MKSLFRLPGPTPLPPEVMTAMQRPMISHRSDAFSEFYVALLRRLRHIHLTDDYVVVWPASGSAAWEIALTNLLAPGDAVLSVSMGDFGDRFRSVAIRLGLDVRLLDVAWGATVSPEELSGALAKHPEVKAVLLTHNETSTGATNRLQALAATAQQCGALVVVDAVSSAGAIPLRASEWGLDFVLSGSQKAWMCPPGLAIVAASEKAVERAKRPGFKRYFFDLSSVIADAQRGQTPTTPPLSLLYALDAASVMMEAEGLERLWQRHAELGARTRSGIRNLGLRVLPEEVDASATVTACYVPEGIRSGEIVRVMSESFGITIAGGQGKMADSILRIGHMGWVDEADIDACLNGLEGTLKKVGANQ